MNFDLTDDQEMVRDTFARFLDENSSTVLVRAAQTGENGPVGFDPALWQGLAELGAFGMRVPEEAGGMNMGVFDAALVMEEAGRTLASGPLLPLGSWVSSAPKRRRSCSAASSRAKPC
jgi:alkylation response protein AidB-like acyl-CoA dehydrogenase